MHIPDGMLDGRTLAATWLAALPVVGLAVRRVRRAMTDGRLVLMAVLSGLVFALQMLNFPVAGGTSGHFTGGALVAIVLGPFPAILVMTAVLVVQAMIFGDGGVTALAANVLNLAILAPLTGWWLYSLAARVGRGRIARIVGASAAAWASSVVAASGAAVMLWTSSAVPLAAALGAMTFWHMLIGIGEALVTAGLVAYVDRVRPDLLGRGVEPMRPLWLAVSLGSMAVLAAGMSFMASSDPDGLERVVERLGIDGSARTATVTAPLEQYLLPGMSNERLAGILAAVVGVVVTGSLLYAIVRGTHPKDGGAR